jgi:hypothetical protein
MEPDAEIAMNSNPGMSDVVRDSTACCCALLDRGMEEGKAIAYSAICSHGYR